MKKVSIGLGLLAATLMTTTASAGTMKGVIKDSTGKAMNGVMVRVTNSDDVSEVVFTNSEGMYSFATEMEGPMNVRLRTPYFKDSFDKIELSKIVAVCGLMFDL